MFVRNKKKILLKALSMWCVYMAGLAELIPYIVPYLDAFIPQWVSLALLIAAPVARIIKQDDLATGDDDAES